MSAPSSDVLRWGHERARAGSWRGDRSIAFISPLPDAPLPSAEFLRRCLDTLAQRGFTRVVTVALSPLEQTGFLAAGFGVEEQLRLLGLDLASGVAPPLPGARLVHPRFRRRRQVLVVDAAAFPPFWRFDRAGLADAIAATPHTRFRAALDQRDGSVTGYAICGWAGRRGFVQRLAVHPLAQRQGSGQRLLADGLYWMARHGVTKAVVNTQMGNAAALSLYRATGFTDEPTGLSVLSTGLS